MVTAEASKEPTKGTGKIPKSGAKAKKALKLLGVLLIGIVIGYFLSNVINDDGSNFAKSEKITATVPATDLRASFVILGVEHANLMNRALNSSVDGAKDTNASKDALYANSDELSDALGVTLGDDFKTNFTKNWNTYLDNMILYAQAVNKNDETAKENAKSKVLDEFIPNFTEQLTGAIPTLEQSRASNLVKDMVENAMLAVDYRKQGEHAKEVEQLRIANKQIEAVFSSIAEATVQKDPNRFKTQ